MKKVSAAALAIVFLGTGLIPNKVEANWLDNYRNSNSRDMCMGNAFDQKVDAVLLDEIPSILSECGIGGMLDLCGSLGFLGSFGSDFLGGMLGCNGSGGEGGSRSRFCDWGFNSGSAKEAWRVIRRAGKTSLNTPNNEAYYAESSTGENSEINQYVSEQSNEVDEVLLAQVRYRVLGLTLENN